MEQYACARRENTEALCAAMAVSGCGIFAGVLLFLLFGSRADAPALAARYFADRAFTSYVSAKEFLRFFSGWFLHMSLPVTAALFCAVTTHPLFFGRALCFALGAGAGFVTALMSGAGFVFTAYCALSRSFLLVLSAVVSVKGALYARERLRMLSGTCGDTVPGRRWFFRSLLPLLTGWLLSLGALTAAMTVISAASCFL